MDGLHRDLIREKVNGSVCVRERGRCMHVVHGLQKARTLLVDNI